MKRVVVGLSGGVDSSVAAYLLKEQGYEVIGLFMKNWHDDSVTISNECPWLEDSNDALLVAEKLGIPFQTVDLSEQYQEKIVDYMFKEYENGRTPNPDVLCNREIKFDVFMKIAVSLGADYVATGHYCRKNTIEVDGKEVHQLLAGKDDNKDQSYFLCQLSQDQLAKALFPIGELTKPEVREIATKMELVTAEKKDSQGLCFIGKVRLPEFLQQKLQPKEGLFVIQTDVINNIIYVGEGANHPGLFKNTLFVKSDEVHWIRQDLKLTVGETTEVMARIRYRQPLQKATLHQFENGMYVQFENPQSAITEGQFVAWYIDDELQGSGVIS